MCPKDLGIKYNRDSGTIIGKLKVLKVFKPTRYRFTQNDYEWLKDNYSHVKIEDIKKHFPNTSIQTIRAYCCRNNIKMKDFGWTKDDEEIIHKYHETKSVDELFKILNGKFSKDAISSKRYKLDYCHDQRWTGEEIEILRNNYSVKPISCILNILSNRTYDGVVKKAIELGLPSQFCLKTYWSRQDEDFLITNWKEYSDYELALKLGKDVNSISEKRNSLRLLRCGHGSSSTYKSLAKFIRGNIGEWKNKSMKQCNYRCIITGESNFQIHHLYSFSKILNETIKENKDIKIYSSLSNYTDDELFFILSKFKEKQAEYPLGVCLREDLHILFHQLYGRHDVNERQFYNFKNDCLKGKYIQTS